MSAHAQIARCSVCDARKPCEPHERGRPEGWAWSTSCGPDGCRPGMYCSADCARRGNEGPLVIAVLWPDHATLAEMDALARYEDGLIARGRALPLGVLAGMTLGKVFADREARYDAKGGRW